MKKLLLISFVIISLSTNSQTLYTDDFTGFTVGNIGTNLTGTVAGQGGFFTSSQDFSAANSNFQIVNEGGVYGNVAQIIGYEDDARERAMWRNGINNSWSTRTSGNNILEVEYDFFTGAVSTSINRVGIYIIDAGFTRYLALLYMDFDTKRIFGSANNGVLNLGPGGTALTLAPNTWVKLGMSFNKTTGEVKYKGPGFNSSFISNAAGIDPNQIRYSNSSGTFNTVSGVNKFDNLIARASNVDTLLSNESFEITSNNFTVSPNPANDFVNISNSNNIKVSNIKITDLNGRVVKQNNFDSVSAINLNISDLSSGIYLMNIIANEGSWVKKVIKN